jgi:hypothetical protein
MSLKNFNPLQVKQNLCQGASDIISSDNRGQVFESGYSLSDTATTGLDKVVRSAAFIEAGLDGKMDLVPSAVPPNVAIFDAQGQVIDSGYKLDDTAPPAANVLYSSLKLTTKVYLRGSFSASVAPDGSAGFVLPGVSIIDPEATWSGTTFTAPRVGRYLCHAVVRLFNGQALADGWHQLEIQSPLGIFTDRVVFPSANSGVGTNDSLMLQFVDTVYLTAGQQVLFAYTQSTGFPKTVDPSKSIFVVTEL